MGMGFSHGAHILYQWDFPLRVNSWYAMENRYVGIRKHGILSLTLYWWLVSLSLSILIEQFCRFHWRVFAQMPKYYNPVECIPNVFAFIAHLWFTSILSCVDSHGSAGVWIKFGELDTNSSYNGAEGNFLRHMDKIWASNYIHKKQWDLIIHPLPYLSGGFVKPPLKLGHGWVITSHIHELM